jgi:hypothetical protein
MTVLSKYLLRAAKTARFCRTATENIRRPALLEKNGLAISVGSGGTANFYFSSANLYEAQFSIDADNCISWTRNDLNQKRLQEIIDCFFFLILELRGIHGSRIFRHWCGISCSREHSQ